MHRQCFEPSELIVKPKVHEHTTAYIPPIDEFVITRIDLKPGESQALAPQSSPCILLVTEGSAVLAGRKVAAGATYLEAADPSKSNPLEVTTEATPSQLYRVFAKETY